MFTIIALIHVKTAETRNSVVKPAIPKCGVHAYSVLNGKGTKARADMEVPFSHLTTSGFIKKEKKKMC